MRVLCLNAWGGRERAALLDWLPRVDADVICLQEVIHTPASAEVMLTYRDGGAELPQSANLYSEVSAALPGHAGIFCPAAQGPLWDGDVPVPSQWGLATWVRRTIPIAAQRAGFVHGTFSPDGYGAHPRSRSGHALRLWDGAAARFVTVAQMHGLRDPAGKHDTPARAAQARAFLALAGSVAGPGDLRVLCGDFNVEPESETLAILREAGFTELVTAHGHPGTRTSLYPKPGRFADYLCVDDTGPVAAFEVLTTPEVSDHCPLLLTLTEAP